MYFNVLDVSALAAYVIYYENNNMLKKKTNQRRISLHHLSEVWQNLLSKTVLQTIK